MDFKHFWVFVKYIMTLMLEKYEVVLLAINQHQKIKLS